MSSRSSSGRFTLLFSSNMVFHAEFGWSFAVGYGAVWVVKKRACREKAWTGELHPQLDRIWDKRHRNTNRKLAFGLLNFLFPFPL